MNSLNEGLKAFICVPSVFGKGFGVLTVPVIMHYHGKRYAPLHSIMINLNCHRQAGLHAAAGKRESTEVA